MSENIEDQFAKFLADNKIDISALEGTKEKQKLLTEAKDQRNLAIIRAVSTRYSNAMNLKKQSQSYILHPWLSNLLINDIVIET